MNWSKYTLDEWLEQFGAWCESCRMKSGHCPDNLQVNLIDKLMIETGYKKIPRHKNTLECKITDDEALQVQDLVLSVLRCANGEIKRAIIYLYLHKVDGFPLRKIADICDEQKDNLSKKIYGAKCFIVGKYGFLKI